MKTKLKVALAHDYLRDYGGAERVLEALHEIYPDAPVYVSFADPKVMGIHWQRFADWDIHQSWLTRIPFYKQLFSPLRIWAPNYFSSFDLSEYDVVISSTNAYFSKAVRVNSAKGAKQICYCHTPARSLYGYTTMTDWQKNPLTHFAGTLINHYLRVVDVKIAQKVDFFLANSKETQRRIQKFYRRDSTVIYPPVDVPAELPSTSTSAPEYYLYVNRLALAKHPELAVEVCNSLNLPLKIVGTGKMEEGLKEMASSSIKFLGSIPDDQLHKLYANAKALIYPVEDEDFGIVPVEAMGYGVPVIAHRSGGPEETIIDGQTGIFFDELTAEGLTKAIHKFQATKFDRQKIHKHALEFSKEKFQEKIKNFVTASLTQ